MLARVAWILFVALLLSPVGHAQQGAAAARANELARQAKAEYDQGAWAGALKLFESAEAKAHSPVLLLYAARCQRNLGDLVRAQELLQIIIDEKLPATAPPPFRNAQQDAVGDAEALRARIPKIVIDRAQAPASWQVTVDGAIVDAESILVNPGKHLVTAREGAVEHFRQGVELAESESRTITVASTAKTGSQADEATPSEPGTQTTDAAAGDGSAAIAAGAVLLAVGVAGLGVGVGLRVTALSKFSEVEDRCIGNSCLVSDAEEVDDAETLQTVSTILFAAGGAIAATGVILLIVRPGASEEPAVSLDLRPGYFGVRGSF
jgi:hypothetical protein